MNRRRVGSLDTDSQMVSTLRGGQKITTHKSERLRVGRIVHTEHSCTSPEHRHMSICKAPRDSLLFAPPGIHRNTISMYSTVYYSLANRTM